MRFFFQICNTFLAIKFKTLLFHYSDLVGLCNMSLVGSDFQWSMIIISKPSITTKLATGAHYQALLIISLSISYCLTSPHFVWRSLDK